MEHRNEHVLLQKCLQAMHSALGDTDDRALRRWWEAQASRVAGLTACLLAVPDQDWYTAILQHRAHRHPWYDQLAQEASLEEFATYLLETRDSHASLALFERAWREQISHQARLALRCIIEIYRRPMPQALLSSRLMRTIKAKAGDSILLESFNTLIDRHLTFYYGYFCEPWNLVGALYASEVMADHQSAQMEEGLVRLGFESQEFESMRVHLLNNAEHGVDWNDEILAPSVRINPTVRVLIAEGIAACLETSARYLDDLCIRQIQRAHRACIALGSQVNWANSSH